jgi:3-oxoacyl-[acyl-carrier-protein] synthase III
MSPARLLRRGSHRSAQHEGTPVSSPRYSRITGTGSHLPPRRLTNADLAAELAARGVETSDAWIVERTGIRARHFAADGVVCSDLALAAA